MARSESSRVAMVDGGSIQVRSVGSDDVACLFVHGFADGAYVWDSCIRAAMSTQRMVTMDLRGHGDSSWIGSGRYSAQRLTDDILAVADALGLQRFVLIGHSLGGAIALRLSARVPERIAGIVVVDTAPTPADKARAHLLKELKDSIRPYRSVADYEDRLRSLRPLLSPRLVRHIAEHSLRASNPGVFEFKADPRLDDLLAGNEDGSELWKALRQLACPALIVRGALSGILSQETAEQMAREARNARLQVVDDAGHSVMLDNPAGFNAAVSPFLKSFSLNRSMSGSDPCDSHRSIAGL
jgi:pimeloyl-ACP methyl ester carboxylesterase